MTVLDDRPLPPGASYLTELRALCASAIFTGQRRGATADVIGDRTLVTVFTALGKHPESPTPAAFADWANDLAEELDGPPITAPRPPAPRSGAQHTERIAFDLIRSALAAFDDARNGISGNDEHVAALELRNTVHRLLGIATNNTPAHHTEMRTRP